MPPQLNQEILSQLDQAANQLTELVFSHLQSERGVHLETAIAAPACLAGTLIVRSTGINFKNMQPGAPLFADELNQKGMEVFAFMQGVCRPLGLDPSTGWQGPLPEGIGFLHSPQELSQALEKPFLQAIRAFKLDDEWLPYIAGFASLKIVKMGAQSLNPDTGKAIALTMLGTTSKQVPYAEKP
ncbi:MAG: hypothetical protein JW862_12085 [Anaerolineales bacterium]|nr:hypothetical protein [Anaerolineales bacterium]